ncbi:MAG: alanine--glyoxylate aminotransferase family protein [Bacteroidales bacterium]|nr:alanine--glyoxylate aminotransferase family protein [Bacteroidales bacterium]
MKDRSLLMIPGPVEFEPAVLQALGAPTTSHVAPDFIEIFGSSISLMRGVFLCPSGQPFIIAGSGTLAMDMVAANLIEQGDNVLVVSTGYFGDRYEEIAKRYGAEVTCLHAAVGGIVTTDVIEAELKKKSYKFLTFTHVDTSTAVKVNPKPIGELGKKYGVLTVLDGVCSVGGEEMRQEEWGIDVAFTASQKAIGVPPGLALIVASPKAIDTWKKRKTNVTNFYSDWKNWLPIMEAYENRKPSYFATPAVNHVCALFVGLNSIIKEGVEARITRHHKFGKAFQKALSAIGLKQVPLKQEYAASTMSAPYYPEGIAASGLLPKIKQAGVIVAGGLHQQIKDKYFRIGHMGAVKESDLYATIGAVESGLHACGYSYDMGAGTIALHEELNRKE